MKYNAPKIDGKLYYIPVVVKSKDYLIGYLHSMNIFGQIMEEALNKAGISIGGSCIEPSLDSTRFNDVMMDGRRASECSNKEITKMFNDLISQKMTRLTDEHPDNDIENEDIFNVDCPCGLGFYSFKEISDIPDKQFKCSICGRVIIDYTNQFDSEFNFDEKEIENYENFEEDPM